VYEQQFVTIGIAHEVIHGMLHFPNAQLHMMVSQQLARVPR
jgi:hypothetical protein